LPDRPFLAVDQPITPDSSYSNYSDPRSLTPVTPSTQLTSPASIMSRKPGTISRTPSPPSPQLQSNMDSAFPVFPAPLQVRRQSPDTMKTRKRSLFAPLPGDKALMAPLSPRVNGGADVLKRMDKLAAGPFAGPARKLEEKVPPRLKRNPSDGEQKHFRNASGKEQFPRPSTSQSNRSQISNQPERQASPFETSQHREPPQRPSRPTETVDRFLEQLQSDSEPSPPMFSAAMPPRSQTFPETSVNANALRGGMNSFLAQGSPYGLRPGEQPLRSAGLSPSPNPFGWSKEEEPLRPSTSRGRSNTTTKPLQNGESRLDRRRPNEPPVPLLPGVQRRNSEKSLDSSHGASDSSSTLDSTATSAAASQASSQSEWSNPPNRSRSDSGRSDRRRNLSNTDPINRSQSADTTGKGGSPPRPIRRAFTDMPESPLDPAIQWGNLPPTNYKKDDRLPRESRFVSKGPPRQSEAPPLPSLKPRADAILPSRNNNKNGLLSPSSHPRSRGNCRGCSRPILIGQKSVKAADGRLSGRYHKECFVCKTCSSPFPTGEFYVLQDRPYCGRHWHKLNGSLCKSCDEGIEGVYLETDRREKWHTQCFGCSKCMIPLPEDYFEVDGRPYCQRHAFSVVKRDGNGQGRNPEKRRTKLMTMQPA
jgi:LIM domain